MKIKKKKKKKKKKIKKISNLCIKKCCEEKDADLLLMGEEEH